MFWKNVKRVKSLSIVTTLALLYSLSTIGIFIVIALFLYPDFSKITQAINKKPVSTYGNQLDSEKKIKICPTEINRLCIKCYKKTIVVLLASSIASIFLGYLVARNGLARMREFENKIENIHSDLLHERINIQDWPKELRNVGEKFNMMLDRIQISFDQLSQFSSDIAHELRTPLHNLTGLTELALVKEKTSEEYKQTLTLCLEEYHHLSKLIENLLFLARSNHGQMILHKTSFSVKKEILKLFDYYQALAEEKEIELLCQGDATLVADLILFKRMIANLLTNSLHYTSSTKKEIKIEVTSDEHDIFIAIHDQGIGIDSQHLSKLFDRFYRVDTSLNTGSGGLGLGLAIVKSIIDLHKGKIRVGSQINRGTTVYITLPT